MREEIAKALYEARPDRNLQVEWEYFKTWPFSHAVSIRESCYDGAD